MIDNLTLYKFFLQVAKSGSISSAARQLYVTQPAVSSGIMQLENALNAKLFFRTSRGITLTPEGQLLYEYVNSGLTFLEAGEDKLRDISGLNGGLMRVGASDMTLKFFLLDHIESFNGKYPNVKLTVSNNPTPQTIKSLKNGQIDFCVISDPVEKDEDITFLPVRQIRDIVICKNNDKNEHLINRHVDFEELAKDNTLIMLERGTSTRSYIDRFLHECDAPLKFFEPEIELAQSDLILEFVKRGLGVAFIVEDFAKEAIDNGVIAEVKLQNPVPTRQFMLGYLNKIPLSAAAKKFIAEITEGSGNTK
jgi:Transcriptional regulator